MLIWGFTYNTQHSRGRSRNQIYSWERLLTVNTGFGWDLYISSRLIKGASGSSKALTASTRGTQCRSCWWLKDFCRSWGSVERMSCTLRCLLTKGTKKEKKQVLGFPSWPHFHNQCFLLFTNCSSHAEAQSSVTWLHKIGTQKLIH